MTFNFDFFELLQATSWMGTRAEMGTLHGPTSQVTVRTHAVHVTSRCCPLKLLFLSFEPLSVFVVTLSSRTCTAGPQRAHIHYLWSMCIFWCLCVLHSGGKRWSTRPRSLHPLPRSLQKLLCPWRLSVPQHPGPAVLQVHTHTNSHTHIWVTFNESYLYITDLGHGMQKRNSLGKLKPVARVLLGRTEKPCWVAALEGLDRPTPLRINSSQTRIMKTQGKELLHAIVLLEFPSVQKEWSQI